MNIHNFWKEVLLQDKDKIRAFFHEDANINWHCTNENFTVDEFIQANCEYPGEWEGEIERIEKIDNLIITVTHVYPPDRTSSFHVVSFIKIINTKIISMDEYWADDGEAPKWRLDKSIGRAIK